MVKNEILKELETLTNEGKFEELVFLYITTFVNIQPDPQKLRKIKKKVVDKLKTRQEAFQKVNLERIKMRILNEDLELVINMVQNDLTRTIILLVSYMIKHGNDETTKEVFQWVKEHRHDSTQGIIKTIEKGLGKESV